MKTLDESDFEQGFRDLVGARKVDFARQAISALLYVVAGGCASWAVNAYTSADVPDGQGHWAIGTMFISGGLAAFVQHWRGWHYARMAALMAATGPHLNLSVKHTSGRRTVFSMRNRADYCFSSEGALDSR